jgi:hypothetical protein
MADTAAEEVVRRMYYDLAARVSLIERHLLDHSPERPKRKVKKWRWVYRYPKGSYNLRITCGIYADQREFSAGNNDGVGRNGVLVQKIDSTEIEVECD